MDIVAGSELSIIAKMERSIILKPIFGGLDQRTGRVTSSLRGSWINQIGFESLPVQYNPEEHARLVEFLTNLSRWRNTGIPVLLPPSASDDAVMWNPNLFGNVESLYRGYFYIFKGGGDEYSPAPASIFTIQGETIDQFLRRASVLLGTQARIIPHNQFITHTKGRRPEEFGDVFFRYGSGYSRRLENIGTFTNEGMPLSTFVDTLQQAPLIKQSKSFDEAIAKALKI